MASWSDNIRQRNRQLDAPTAAPAVPDTAPVAAAAPATPDYAKMAKENLGFTGWNPDNFTDYSTIMARANKYQEQGGETAGTRDWLQNQFNSFYEPIAANYRQQMASRGTPADATDANLMREDAFRNFARTGQLPAQTLTQQWTQGPPIGGFQAPSGSWGSPGDTRGGFEPGTDPRRQALYDEIMKRYRDNDGVVGRDNAMVRSQADAHSAQQTREMRDYLADLAEREGPNANLRGEQRMAQEMAGRNSGAFEAELIAREQANRRAIQGSSLDSAVRVLDVDAQQALARELGLSDLELRRMQLGQSNDQFLRELAMREWDLMNRNDLVRRGLV